MLLAVSQASAIRGELRRRLDKRQSAGGNAGLDQSVTVMGDVGGHLPAEIAQMPFDGKGRIIVEQDFHRVGRFLGAPELASAAARIESA